jgi:hypothetical protein
MQFRGEITHSHRHESKFARISEAAMTIEETKKIDFISISKTSGDVRLTISDHLKWNGRSMERSARLARPSRW